MRAALALLALLGSLTAQPPPLEPVPAFGTINCAFRTGWQLGDLWPSCGWPACPPAQSWNFDLGECWLGGYCDAAHTMTGSAASGSPIVLPLAVHTGHSMFWQCMNMQAGTTIPHTLGSAAVMFALSPFQVGQLTTAPFAAPGWNSAFGNGHILFDATHTYTQTIAWQPIESWILEMPIPATPSLFGTLVQCQAIRFEPANGLFYLSNGMTMQVGN